VGIYGLQAYGIFKVRTYALVLGLNLTTEIQIGEIIGRRSLVGYKTH
jgi:hypothetical protein